jgi:hypothetical protein
VTSPAFLLDKWYLDCVSPGGDAFVGYAARLRWRGLHLDYASFLLAPRGGAAESRTTLRAGGGPVDADGELAWRCAPLGIDGRWKAEAPPLERTLLRRQGRAIRWSCVQPRAAVMVTVADRPALRGLGYAERLTMTMAPWSLPLRELRWGRFLSPSDTVVWIEWRGPHPLALVFHNGCEAAAGCITDRRIGFDAASLDLAESQLLRQGPLVRTALAKVPILHRLAPWSILATHETKWCSRGELLPSASAGWAIHEVVVFPEPPA